MAVALVARPAPLGGAPSAQLLIEVLFQGGGQEFAQRRLGLATEFALPGGLLEPLCYPAPQALKQSRGAFLLGRYLPQVLTHHPQQEPHAPSPSSPASYTIYGALPRRPASTSASRGGFRPMSAPGYGLPTPRAVPKPFPGLPPYPGRRGDSGRNRRGAALGGGLASLPSAARRGDGAIRSARPRGGPWRAERGKAHPVGSGRAGASGGTLRHREPRGKVLRSSCPGRACTGGEMVRRGG